jgi:hypothetical protein
MNYLKHDSEVLRRNCYSYSFSLEIVLDRISSIIDRLDDYLWFSKESIVNGKINNFSKRGISIGVYQTVSNFMDKALEMLNKSVENYTNTLNQLTEKSPDATDPNSQQITSSITDDTRIFDKTLARAFTTTKLNSAGLNLKRVMRVFYYYAENLDYILNRSINFRLEFYEDEFEIDYETIKFVKDCIKIIKHIARKYEIVFSIFREEHPEEETLMKEAQEEAKRREEESKSKKEKTYGFNYKTYTNIRKEKTIDERIEESYTILKIPVGSTLEEVKKAYKSMIKKYHPDLFGNDEFKREKAEELTCMLNRAYEDLLDYLTSVS